TTASCMVNAPVIMTAKAIRNTVREAASLTKLSPSNKVTPRFGMLTPLRTEVAATASGGEIIPPNRNPNASVNPGIKLTDKYATAMEVTKTSPKPMVRIDLRLLQKLFHEVYHAASNNRGGRKTKN